ncbi:MAG: bifunctional phosphoglucose/phosphomannose isomerase [Chloroflexota bacterium]
MALSLDRYSTYEKLDPGGMGGHLSGFPSQCRRSWRRANQFNLPTKFHRVNRVVVLGMGGSAIGADLVSGLISPVRASVTVSRDYSLPASIGDRTLMIASSYSGMTEETLSSFNEALKLKCPKLVITSGGDLAEVAERNGVPVFRIDYEAPPRAALAWSFVPLLVILQRLGLIANGDARLGAVVKLLDRLAAVYGTEAVTATNPAKMMAGRLHNRLVVVYGAGFLTAVAQRWKTQVNENSKSWSFYEVFPELNHNAIEGYRCPDLIRRDAHVIMLGSPLLDERLKRRYWVTADILRRAGVKHEMVESQGDDRLSQMMSLIYLGDWVSYYLAMLNGVDPSLVDRIAYLKKRLSRLE